MPGVTAGLWASVQVRYRFFAQVSTNMLDVLVYFFKLHIPIIVIYIVVLCNIVKNKKWDVSETSEWCHIFFIINPPKKIYFYYVNFSWWKEGTCERKDFWMFALLYWLQLLFDKSWGYLTFHCFKMTMQNILKKKVNFWGVNFANYQLFNGNVILWRYIYKYLWIYTVFHNSMPWWKNI